MKRISVILIVLAAAILYTGCGGEMKLTGNYAVEGAKISYSPAAGKTVYYRSDSDDLTEFSEQGYSQSTLSKSTSYQSFTVDYVKNDTTSITYEFLSEEVGVFQNGSFEQQDEESDLIGQKLTIVVDRDGKLVDWSGLEDIEPNESGIDRGEMIASNYASIFFDHFPAEKQKVGDTWKRENIMDVSTKEGDMRQQTTKDYEVVDFVERDGLACVKCKVIITILNTGEGTTDDDEGNTYAYFNEGRGEGKGTVYFAFESGVPVYTTFNWIVDFTITSVNQTTQEENEFSYYNEQKVVYHLVDQSEVKE